MQSITMLFLMASCLNLIVAADKQSAYRASSNVDASLAQLAQQRQRSQQQQQQQLSSRLPASDEQMSSSGTFNNASHYQLLEPNTPSEGWDGSSALSDSSFSDGSVFSDGSHVNKVHASNEDYDRYNFRNVIEDLLHIPIKSNWLVPQSTNSKHLFKNNYFSEYMQKNNNGTYQQRDDHHLDKREATDHLSAGEEQPDPELLDDYYPILLDRRFQVFRSNDPFSSSPYLSAQEFKETFRRSDPYVVGKRTRDLLGDLMIPVSEDKRVAPKFVGRRDPPYFVGKREMFNIPDSYLADLNLEEYQTPLVENRRAAPKFVGRRGAPYFVGKRGAPMFVGKRVPILALQNDDSWTLENKRAAPRFVGKRRAPFFVGKREHPYNLQGSWSDLSSGGNLDWLLEKKGAPKFVGRRGAPYFVGKRGPPMFIGKRGTDSEIDNESTFGYGQNEVANLLGRRGSPYFVGKRGAPRFVGKRWAEPGLQRLASSSTQDKRRAPKFVGRRGSPYFVGKRGLKQLGDDGLTEDGAEEESQTLLEFKRGAPAFVGKRRAPYFVGKRGPPRFVGRRLADGEWSNPSALVLEDKHRPVKFIDRRAAPFFVGDAETNNVPERSPDLIFDGLIPSENRNFVPFESGNQYDLTSARDDDFSLKHDLTHDKQIANANTDSNPSNNGYGEVSSNTQEDFTRSILSKRFNEFVGKRGNPSFSSDDGTLHDNGLSTNGMWISSPESYPGQHDNRISSPDSIESHFNAENLLRHLYNDVDLLKRQYEFVGKRNYDFVGKRNYDFVGKRSYDFLGKRSPNDFIGKSQPFHFLYKKSYDFLGKRAPYEFVGKRNEEIDSPIDIHGKIPSWQIEGRARTIYENILPRLLLSAQVIDDKSKRYSEFLGKKKRSIEGDDTTLSTSERLAALLQNNGLRKRLSRLLLNQHSFQHNPDFVGK